MAKMWVYICMLTTCGHVEYSTYRAGVDEELPGVRGDDEEGGGVGRRKSRTQGSDFDLRHLAAHRQRDERRRERLLQRLRQHPRIPPQLRGVLLDKPPVPLLLRCRERLVVNEHERVRQFEEEVHLSDEQARLVLLTSSRTGSG